MQKFMKPILLGMIMLLPAVCPQLAKCETAAEAWVRRYSQIVDSNDEATKIATDSVGNVIVAGLTDDGINGDDILILKYSGSGVPLWTNRYNGPANKDDFPSAMTVDASGNVIVTGSSRGETSELDYVTLKYSSAGVPLWTNRYNGPGNQSDYAEAMALDSSGNVYVTGFSTGMGTREDFASIKYSSEGLPLCTNRYNGQGDGSDGAY